MTSWKNAPGTVQLLNNRTTMTNPTNFKGPKGAEGSEGLNQLFFKGPTKSN